MRIWYRLVEWSIYGLATNLNGFIIVADGDNHRVAIFDKDHNNAHCFGFKGSANGQFYFLDGIALGPNDSIYVSDIFNSRIQIYILTSKANY